MELLEKKKMKKTFKSKTKKKEERKKPDKSKRGRLFIKNLPFKLSDAEFKTHFEQYGEIIDAQLLKNSDGKLKGCGFINYAKKMSAVKAILKSNNKSFKERTISVDWAVPKTKYEKTAKSVKQVATTVEKTEKLSEEDEEKDDDSDIAECEIMDTSDVKSEADSDQETEVKFESEDSNDDDEEDDDDDESEEDEEEEDDDDDTSVKREDDDNMSIKSDRKKVKSNDITEGKTVFLRNVPFHIDTKRLREIMRAQFGPEIYYALVCIDNLTEHSKGTAFVKFKNLEDAEACIKKGELIIDGEKVTFHPAMDKKQLVMKNEEKQKQFKDSRNLYLVKEGVVIAGSRAAEGVSVNDMTKRVQLEQWKTQMLRNLHMFVSKTRLIVHNLPPEFDDRMLRATFKKQSPPNAVIREAKVMRNIRDVDERGVAKSKEYGFVSYTSHEDALQSLRNVNNNPTIFNKLKRPIVAFSIENRAILNAKTKRMEKSREKNPIYQAKYNNDQKKTPYQKPKHEKQKYTKDNFKNQKDNSESDSRGYKGMVSKPTQNITFAKKHKLNKQLETHKNNVQRSKKDMKSKKKKKNVSKLNTKDPVKTKQNKKKSFNDDKQFNQMISSYKARISSGNNNTKVKKWYDT